MNEPQVTEARDSNGKPLDLDKVERASMLLVDLHPLLAYDSARRIVENAIDVRWTAARPSTVGEDVERAAKAIYDARKEPACNGERPCEWEELDDLNEQEECRHYARAALSSIELDGVS